MPPMACSRTNGAVRSRRLCRGPVGRPPRRRDQDQRPDWTLVRGVAVSMRQFWTDGVWGVLGGMPSRSQRRVAVPLKSIYSDLGHGPCISSEERAMESTPGASPPTGEGYEFTTSENNVIRSTGSRVKTWGVFSLIAGALPALGGVALFFTGEVAGVVTGIIFGLLALIPIFIGLKFVRAGQALGAVVGTEGSDIEHLMSAIQNLGAAFLIQIVAAVSWVGIFIVLVSISMRSVGDTRERAYLAAERSDLRNLATVQELFFADNADADGVSEYAGSMAALSESFVTSSGVTISITEASEVGWAATSMHAALPGSGCAIYVGSVTPPTTAGGTVPEEEGRPACDR